MGKPGHNSGGVPEDTKAMVDRIERLENEKAEVAESIKELYAEAKSKGHDVKVLRAVIRRRRQDAAKLEEFETSLQLYEAYLLS